MNTSAEKKGTPTLTTTEITYLDGSKGTISWWDRVVEHDSIEDAASAARFDGDMVLHTVRGMAGAGFYSVRITAPGHWVMDLGCRNYIEGPLLGYAALPNHAMADHLGVPRGGCYGPMNRV